MRNIRLQELVKNMRFIPPVFVLLFFFAHPNVQAAAAPSDTLDDSELSIAITSLISGKQNSLLTKADFSELQVQLAELYRLNDNQLLWLAPERSKYTIDTAIALLDNAEGDGLDSRDYDAEILRQELPFSLALPRTAVNELAKYDTALSIAMLRFINDLHYGRVKPQQLQYPSEFGHKQTLDIPSLLKLAVEQHALSQLPDLAAPRLKQYRDLKKALAVYRNQPKELNFQPLIFEKSLRPGNSYPQIKQLKARLIALGVITAEQSTSSSDTEETYSETLQEVVKEFQRQNGLVDDGVVGQETAARLNQTAEQKVRQIELAMERLRWLPSGIDGPIILVNIPAFQLWAFKSLDDPDILNMKVIVGKARKNQTPMLFEEMKYLEFMPYWNIPKSIMNKEILPKLHNNLAYLQSEDIELVQLHPDQETGSWDTVFDDIRRGRVRARQRPGNKNPLGKVKFVFPNKEDVYLHDTSSHRLFNRSQRDFSHGCVRVAEAGKLAEFVLSIQPETRWDETSIQEAMSGEKTKRVNLKKPIPVLFFYTTTYIDRNGQIYFYRDIYGQDKSLEKALGRKYDKIRNDSLLTAKVLSSG